MKRKLFLTVSIILIAVLSLSLFACAGKDDIGETVNPFIEGIGEAPKADLNSEIIDASKVSLSAEGTTDISVLESAVYLFDIANYNIQNVEYWNSIAYGSGTATIGGGLSGSMEVRDIYVKDGTKSYMKSFGRIVKASDNAKTLLGIMQSMLDYGKIRYSEDGETVYYINGGHKSLDKDSVKNFLTDKETINVEKASKDNRIIYPSAAVFERENFARGTIFEIDNADIQTKYLEEASITHDDEKGLYTVTMKVDPTSDALTLGRQSLRKSASSKDLDYVYQTIIFEVWDCGVLRSYCTDNSWTATIYILNGSSENNYYRYFGYDKSLADKTKIPAVEEMSWMSTCTVK